MKLKMTRIFGNEKGMMLITTLGLVATVMTLSATMLTTSMIEIKAAERFQQRTVAFHWAEGAIDQTLVNLKSNNSYSGVPSTSGSGQVAGTYLSTVTALGNNVYKVSSTAGITGTSSVSSQYRTLEAYVNLSPSPLFKKALFANQTIAMSGNARTGAFDFSSGTFNPTSSTILNEGHIGSNRSGANTIVLSGNVKVQGDAAVGPGANLQTAIVTTGHATISGTESAAATTTVLDPVVVSGGTNLGALTIIGDSTQTLAAGTYVVSSLLISGNGRLNLTGNTTIYVTGNATIRGNGIGTASNLPSNLALKVKGTQVNLSGNAPLYGTIYAPSSQVNISGHSAVYGAVIANWINHSGNGKVIFDTGLAGSGGNFSSSQVTYWTEL